MGTECGQGTLEFQELNGKAVEAAFDGGKITSDGGGLLLREVERRTGIIRQFAACFKDYRDPELIEHTKEELVGQRVYGLALGYEDLNDHDDLRRDPLLAVMVGKKDPMGENRTHARDKGKPLAGKSTLNRMELTKKDTTGKERYKKIRLDGDAVDRFMVEVFLQAHARPPKRIILDLDATDDPIHGNQENRFYHGYYGDYCYLPLYIFCGDFLLCARLRKSNIDASAGSKEELERIVAQIRARWPEVEICIRADSGFCREEIMKWCEENHVDYLLGLAKNSRLNKEIEAELEQAKKAHEESGKPQRVFKDFRYRTLDSWSCERRVVGKAEWMDKGANPRFVVTTLPTERFDAQTLYEQEYCARGEMENRIKEQQMDMFADRTSTATMWANQVRLYFSSVAYMLVEALRRLGLKGTDMAEAQCGTIRTKLLKIGAYIKVTVRRIRVALASGCPYEWLFGAAWRNLMGVVPFRC
jgi:hypothetical protein